MFLPGIALVLSDRWPHQEAYVPFHLPTMRDPGRLGWLPVATDGQGREAACKCTHIPARK